MHEAGPARDLIRRAEDFAIADGARRVTVVTGRIGGPANVTGGTCGSTSPRRRRGPRPRAPR